MVFGLGMPNFSLGGQGASGVTCMAYPEQIFLLEMRVTK